MWQKQAPRATPGIYCTGVYMSFCRGCVWSSTPCSYLSGRLQIRRLVFTHRAAGGGSSTSSRALRRRRRLYDDVLRQHVAGSRSTTSSRIARPAAARLHTCALHGQPPAAFPRRHSRSPVSPPITTQTRRRLPHTMHAWILNHVNLPIQSQIASSILLHVTPFD
jgi:hypothetical protein